VNRNGKKGDIHHVEEVFAFADIDGLLEPERKLYHELKED
jgi:hypothetical protein